MLTLELRDSEEVRAVLLQSLLWQRVLPLSAERMPILLGWALDLANLGDPLPPLGILADIGHLALGLDQVEAEQKQTLDASRFVPATIRNYEDYVLGRVYADSSFERGATALCRYQDDRDRSKGIAFLTNQIQRRAAIGGWELSPSILKSLTREAPELLIEEALRDLDQEGPREAIRELYDDWIANVRNTGDLLGQEDVFELEHETAIADYGQRLALRQVLKGAETLRSAVPQQPVHSMPRRHEVTTNILDEDAYPVGGFTSISNRGTIESLLHSQLAYMERGERPDMFDIKFLRDELLYYSRDENQFLRRRRTFLIVLSPDLVAARLKDPEQPYQRIVLAISMLFVAVRVLLEWLDFDALQFEFVFIESSKKGTGDTEHPLAVERELLEMLFREQRALDLVALTSLPEEEVVSHAEDLARQSLCHVLSLGTDDHPLPVENSYLTRLVVGQPVPQGALDDDSLEPIGEEAVRDLWQETTLWLLRAWLAGPS